MAWSWTFPDGRLADHIAFYKRKDVQEYVGSLYNVDHKRGWRKAYRNGSRAVKVSINLASTNSVNTGKSKV